MTEATTPESTCVTCGFTGGADEFYEASKECKGCKRNRSRTNRRVTAAKVELADQFLAFIRQLTAEGAMRDLAFTPGNSRGPASDCNAAGPLEKSSLGEPR